MVGCKVVSPETILPSVVDQRISMPAPDEEPLASSWISSMMQVSLLAGKMDRVGALPSSVTGTEVVPTQPLSELVTCKT